MIFSWDDMVLHLPCARVPVRKYIFKKKVLCSSDDFCFYVCFQCSLGKSCKGSDKLLDPGGEHSKFRDGAYFGAA